MENAIFYNGAYHLTYRYQPTDSGKPSWQCVSPKMFFESRQFHYMTNLLYHLEPEHWMDYEQLITQPNFEYIRTKMWRARYFMGDITFVYFGNPLCHI